MNFPFNFNLIFNENSVEIQPTSNLFQLKNKAKECFNLKNVNIFYLNENYEEIKIKDDNDYFDLINLITEQKEIDLIIKSGKSSKKKSNEKNNLINNNNNENNNNNNNENNNKNNNNENNNNENNNNENNDYLIGEENDYFIFGDIRNKKLNVNYYKKNRGFKEQKRIFYIKEKKELQRKEQLKKNFDNQEKNFLPVFKNNKRKLKENFNKNDYMFKFKNDKKKNNKY